MKLTIIISCLVSLQGLSQTGYDTLLRKYDDFSNKSRNHSFTFTVNESMIYFRKSPIIDTLLKLKTPDFLTQDTSLPNNSTTSNLNSYKTTTDKANSFFFNKNYKSAIELFEKAFKENNGLGQVIHRYRAACCYALIGDLNNAFIQLEKLSTKGHYYNLKEIESEKAFLCLHKDDRWKTIIQNVGNNVTNKIAELNSTINNN
jgi:DNA-binding ferritin-like protein (Dps family)